MRQSRSSGWDRRELFQAAAAIGLITSSASSLGAAPRDEVTSDITPQPSALPSGDFTTADLLIETLIDWGATHVFGVVGDGINSIIEALRKRQDRIRYIGVRHEEAAAFMACGIAKHTGRLGVCIGTTGPGAIHLMNGLYDAALDGAPVVALTGLTYHDFRGVRYQQGIDTVKLMEPLAVYNEEVTGPEHAIIITNRACRAALGNRGVAHLAVSKDVQMMKRSADKRSTRNPGARTSSSWSSALSMPASDQLRAVADVLNAGTRVAILAGQGALSARDEVTQLADLLSAHVCMIHDDGKVPRFPMPPVVNGLSSASTALPSKAFATGARWQYIASPLREWRAAPRVSPSRPSGLPFERPARRSSCSHASRNRPIASRCDAASNARVGNLSTIRT